MEPEPWCEELKRIIAEVKRAEDSFLELREQLRAAMGSTGLSNELLNLESQVGRALAQIRQAGNTAFERYSARPTSKFLLGLKLTREEYHLLSASVGSPFAAKDLGLSPVDDYELSCLLFYKDDNWRGYVNPDLRPWDPSSGRIGGRFGRSPQELSVDGLRTEQHEFFSEQLPEVYARFRREQQDP